MSPAVFKTDTTTGEVVGWVRFPDAPATFAGSGAATSGRYRLGRPTAAAVLCVAAIAMLGLPAGARAQEPVPPAPADTVQAQAVEADTVPAADALRPDTVRADTLEASEDEPRGEGGAVSPTGALLRSIIIPGWGQTAARQPARGAIYFTVWSGGVFMILKTNADVGAAERGEDEDLLDSRKKAREDWILFTGLWALVSGIDAWVSAQFAGFEGEIRPPQDGSPGVEFAYPVKLF